MNRESQPIPEGTVYPNISDDEDDIIDFRYIFFVLKKHCWPIIFFALSVTLVLVLIVFSMTPVYEATSVLQIEQDQAKVVSIEEIYGIEGKNESYLNTQLEVLKSRGVLEKVVHKLDLLENPEFNVNLRKAPWYSRVFDWRSQFGLHRPSEVEDPVATLRDTIDVLEKSVSIELVRKTQIVKVHAQSQNRELAARIANAIADGYIESYMESRLALTLNATHWMQGRMGELSEKLRDAEQKLQDYREQEQLIDVEGVLTVSSNELKALTDSLVQLRNKLSVSENIYNQIRNDKQRSGGNNQTLQAVLEHPLIMGMKQDESRLERQVLELSQRYGPKHPKMISAQSELKSIQQNLDIEIRNIVEGVERVYELDKANEKNLQAAVEAAKAKVQEINRKQFRLQSLAREVQTNKDLYDAFFKRIQETSATSDLQTANARIIDYAFTPQYPVKPKKMLIIGIGLILSLVAASGIALMLETFNITIRTIKDVEDKLNIPVLGTIPVLTDKNVLNQLPCLFGDKDQPTFSEALRTIRTTMNLDTREQKHRIIALTSSVQGEGKSTVASNLALAVRQLGRTILVDCDLRRPVVGKNCQIKVGSAGLANILTGSSSVSEAVFTFKGINVIPGGTVPPDPQELFASGQFERLLQKLRKHYDYVLLDCPPILHVSDVLLVSGHCDGVIYVVESGRVHAQTVRVAVDRLLQAKAPLMGTVLNKINPKNYYAYGYEDYYGSTEYYSGAT